MKLTVPTAKEINKAHLFAKECAETAVEHAIRCGQLLAAKKDDVGHGNWGQWVEKNCDFSYRVARKYIQVAEEAAKQIGTSMPFSTMAKLLGHDKPKPKPDTPKGAVPVVNPKGTGETGADRPAAPTVAREGKPTPGSGAPPPGVEVTPAPEYDFTGYEPEDDEAYQANIENVLMADDKLSAMREELKQVHRELQAVKSSRDHYQNQAGEAVRLLKARDREIEKLKKQIKSLEGKRAA